MFNKKESVKWGQLQIPANYHATQKQYLFVPCENVAGCIWVDGDNGWKTTTLIDITSGDAVDPLVAGYGSGQALAIWQKPSAPAPLQFSTHTRAAGWVPRRLISPGPAVVPFAIQTKLAAADNGSAIVAWTQLSAGKVSLHTRRCPPGALCTCSAPVVISGQFASAESPSLAGARNGNAIIMWRHAATPGGPINLYSQHYSAVGAAWSSTPVLVDNNVFSVRAAMDNRGIATALWTKSEAGKINLYASRFE